MSDPVQLLRRGTKPDGTPLTSHERETLLKPFLPNPRSKSPPRTQLNGVGLRRRSRTSAEPDTFVNKSRSKSRRKAKSHTVTSLFHIPPIRSIIALLFHKLLFTLIQLILSIYITLRSTYHGIRSRMFALLYYHHKSPELIRKDIKALNRVPKHLSIIVELSEDARESTGSEPSGEATRKLMKDVSEVAAWCTAIGIKTLSVYERTGAMKSRLSLLHRTLNQTLKTYYPPNNHPTFSLNAPHIPPYTPVTPSSNKMLLDDELPHLDILLLSAQDGRSTLVDLTKTLAEMAQAGKISPADITPELIDAEVTESSCGEPDLLVVMAPSSVATSTISRAPRRRRGRQSQANHVDSAIVDSVFEEDEDDLIAEVDLEDEEEDDRTLWYEHSGDGGDVCLRGYPPWQVRLTEIFYVRDGAGGVEYQTFLRALYRYAKCEMRFGR